MKVQILGMGCQKCKALYENTKKAAGELSLELDIEKVEDSDAILDMGVMMTPALVLDGEVKAAGKSLSVEQIKGFLNS